MKWEIKAGQEPSGLLFRKKAKVISGTGVHLATGLMHDTGCLGLVHWGNPEGWYGEGGGRRVQDGEHASAGGFFTG